MKLADSNLWLALTLSKHGFHKACRAWLEMETEAASVFFCRCTQQSYLRLLTTAEVLAPYGIPPLTNAEAWSTYEGWLADERIVYADEPRGVGERWAKLATRKTSSPKLWMDAYLAAFAMAGGYQLVTTDQGFKQHKNLDLIVLSR